MIKIESMESAEKQMVLNSLRTEWKNFTTIVSNFKNAWPAEHLSKKDIKNAINSLIKDGLVELKVDSAITKVRLVDMQNNNEEKTDFSED